MKTKNEATRVIPFRGLTYNPTQYKDLARVVAPPYDVISATEAAKLEARDPQNIVRVILPQIVHSKEKDPYRKSGQIFKEWIRSGILTQDTEPSIYRYHQTFSVNSNGDSIKVTRKGVLALRRLEPWGESVFPHEKTLSKPKKDRAKLLTQCRAHLSPIFGIYSDPRGRVEVLLSKSESKPLWEFKTPDGIGHRLWKITERRLVKEVCETLGRKNIYIADGHHRYETALALAQKEGGEASYGLMFFTNLDDQGLVVLPTHRFFHKEFDWDWKVIERKLRPYFMMNSYEVGGAGRSRFLRQMSSRYETALGMILKDRYVILKAKSSGLRRVYTQADQMKRAKLGAVLLHEVLFEKALRYRGSLEDDFEFTKDEADVFEAVALRKAGVGFLLQTPRVKDVTSVCEAGLTFPQKTTYFYPKLPSGLVFHLLD